MLHRDMQKACHGGFKPFVNCKVLARLVGLSICSTVVDCGRGRQSLAAEDPTAIAGRCSTFLVLVF